MLKSRGLNLAQNLIKTRNLRFIHTEPKKRFYKNVSIVQSNGKFEINLDQRKLKTPMGSPFQVIHTIHVLIYSNVFLKIASEPLAQAVANEWMGQKSVINLNQMHINGEKNSVVVKG